MKLITILLFVLAASISSLSGQTAPDFTITDSWGTTHRLYEDYLDQGKTVVLKIFYVACPPCNSIAPHLEPLYQTWGGGHGDVQFIELSIRQNDTDAQVNTYKNNHATTYPAAGGQGNSVAATMPYTTGTFGPWTGTPTFVVIAPDKSLEYDVYGINIQGTIAALDAAIAATGAQGLPTSVIHNDPTPAVRLPSNLVYEWLTLHIDESMSQLNVVFLLPNGAILSNATFAAEKGDEVRLPVRDLAQGLFICKIEDSQRHLMASYLCIKM